MHADVQAAGAVPSPGHHPGVTGPPEVAADTARPSLHPAWALLGVALLLGCALLPLPGVDQLAAHAQLGRVSAWWAAMVGGLPPAFSPLAGGLLGLVIARGVRDLVVTDDLGPGPRRLWSAVVALLYVLAAALAGAMVGLGLADRFPDLVTAPPLTLALLDAAACAAVASVLWSAAGLIRRTGVANGSLLLFLAWEFLWALRFISELLAAAWSGDPGLLTLVLHTGAVPVALVLAALWRWEPHPWPVPVWRSLAVRSPLDLLAIPLVVGSLASTLAEDLAGLPAWTPQPDLYDPGLVAGTFAGLLTVPALGWWIRRQPGAPGGPVWLGLTAMVLGVSLTLAGLVWLGDGSALDRLLDSLG